MDWFDIQKQGVAMLDKWLGRVGQLDKLSTSALTTLLWREIVVVARF